VNSYFTARTFRDTFTTLAVAPKVLYPSLDFSAFDVDVTKDEVPVPKEATTVFLSINRYERKKDVMLALKALSELKDDLHRHKKDFESVHLVMAGGYDPRVTENVEYYKELRTFAKEQGLEGNVTFLRSISDHEKVALLKHCTCLLYTPANEHFGITPLEAMYCATPVIAVNSGGPLETVVGGEGGPASEDPQTGFLCEPVSLCSALALLSSHEGGSSEPAN